MKNEKIAFSKEKYITKDFILICVANFFLFLGFQMTLPTLPLFIKKLGGSEQIIGIVVGLLMFSALFVRSYAGEYAEIKGRKVVYIFGLSLFVISIATYAFATSLILIFIIRIFQGIGWGSSGTASGTIASDLIPPSRRGAGMGFFALGSNIAMAIGPALALFFNELISFRLIFLLCALCGLIAIFLALGANISKTPIAKKEQIIKEKHRFFEKAVWKPSLLMFFLTFTFGGIASFLPLYVKEINVSGIHLYFTIYALSLLTTRFFAGNLYDKKGLKFVFIPSIIFILCAMLLLSFLQNKTMLLLAAFLYGQGFGIVQPALQAWTISLADDNHRGLAIATLFSSFDLGVGTGAVLFGQISHYLGYQMIYITSAISSLVALVLFFSFTKIKQKRG